MTAPTVRSAFLGAVLGLLTVTGCDEGSEVRVYSVSATTAPAPDHVASATQMGEPGLMQAPPVATSGTPAAGDATAGQLHWSLPPGWQRVAGEKPMRVATFETTQGERLEVALSRFPGDTGGLLANVNRWRQQVGLGPIEEKDLAASLRPVENNTLAGHTMRLRGETQHMLGAILMPADKSESWFVKATAAPGVVDAHEAAFEAFVKSMHLDSQPH
jgi:hypothetical protein